MNRFDPFDPNNRDKRKRRTKIQIEADKKSYETKMDDAYKIALADMHWPDYVQSDFLLEDAAQHYENYYSLRHNMKKCLERIGYIRMINPYSSDGRWKAMGKNVYIYKKELLEDLDRDELAVEMEW